MRDWAKFGSRLFSKCCSIFPSDREERDCVCFISFFFFFSRVNMDRQLYTRGLDKWEMGSGGGSRQTLRTAFHTSDELMSWWYFIIWQNQIRKQNNRSQYRMKPLFLWLLKVSIIRERHDIKFLSTWISWGRSIFCDILRTLRRLKREVCYLIIMCATILRNTVKYW